MDKSNKTNDKTFDYKYQIFFIFLHNNIYLQTPQL